MYAGYLLLRYWKKKKTETDVKQSQKQQYNTYGVYYMYCAITYLIKLLLSCRCLLCSLEFSLGGIYLVQFSSAFRLNLWFSRWKTTHGIPFDAGLLIFPPIIMTNSRWYDLPYIQKILKAVYLPPIQKILLIMKIISHRCIIDVIQYLLILIILNATSVIRAQNWCMVLAPNLLQENKLNG